MNGRQLLKAAGGGLAATAAVAAAGYAALVVLNKQRYGQVSGAPGVGRDSLLDRFIPAPEVSEHHQIDIRAPADVVMSTAKEIELLKSPVIRAVIKARELALGGEPDRRAHPTKLLDQMLSIGWGVLAELPGRELVLGSVTQPWEASPVFRSVPASAFKDFDEPGFVKIAWTLRADPVDPNHSVFHTETRVCTTDEDARTRFRDYWSFVAPGVQVIRMALLRPLRDAAEARSSSHAA